MQTIYWNLQADNETEILKAAGCLLRQGEVVAFPTETVYGLGADGLNGTAVAKIFAAKGRPVDNPLILHIARVEDILPLTSGLTANARALMQSFWPGPLTLIVAKSDLIPDEVSARVRHSRCKNAFASYSSKAYQRDRSPYSSSFSEYFW